MCSSLLPHRPKTNLFIRDLVMTPTTACYCSFVLFILTGDGGLIFTLVGGQGFLPQLYFWVWRGQSLAKHHGPNNTSLSLSLAFRQNEAAVNVERCERKEVLPSTWNTECFHTYAQWGCLHKTVTHGLSLVEIYKNRGTKASASKSLK